jgi:O-antigen/teichoic acid export membrane protein
LLPALSILLFGPWIFSLLFGESWKMSGDFAQLIAIFMYVQLITTPVMHILTVLEKHLEFLKINILRFFLVIIAFLIADFTNANEIGTVFIYSMFMVLHYSTVAIRVLFLR